MHRATPANTSFRAYSSGGARTTIHQADDQQLMQESAGGIMANESRKQVESPQNYGFTSVVHDAEMAMEGGIQKIKGSAEGFMSFIGGNRSFPVCAIMDDRRHRLWGMQKGDTAMYRGAKDQQQFHMTTDGGFWSADESKTVRMQLVPSQQQGSGQGGGGGGGAQALDASGGGGSGGAGAGQSGQGGQQKGQQPVYKQGQNSVYYVDVKNDKTTASGKEVHLKLDDKQTYVHCKEKNVYLGGESTSSRAVSFKRVVLEDGTIAQNVYAKAGGSAVALWHGDDVSFIDGGTF
jgi:phage gp45-like